MSIVSWWLHNGYREWMFQCEAVLLLPSYTGSDATFREKKSRRERVHNGNSDKLDSGLS